MQSVLKRSIREASEGIDVDVFCGPLYIDHARRRVTRDHEEIHLTKTEYSLLHELISHRNRVILHEQLLSAVWGSEYQYDIDYLPAYIHHLRRKLEADLEYPQMIVTSPGVGYMLGCPDES